MPKWERGGELVSIHRIRPQRWWLNRYIGLSAVSSRKTIESSIHIAVENRAEIALHPLQRTPQCSAELNFRYPTKYRGQNGIRVWEDHNWYFSSYQIFGTRKEKIFFFFVLGVAKPKKTNLRCESKDGMFPFISSAESSSVFGGGGGRAEFLNWISKTWECRRQDDKGFGMNFTFRVH